MELETRQTCYYNHCKKLVFASLGVTVQSIYIVFKLNNDYPENHYDDNYKDDDYYNNNDDDLKWKWYIVFIPSYITFGTLMFYGLYYSINQCFTKKQEHLLLNDKLPINVTVTQEPVSTQINRNNDFYRINTIQSDSSSDKTVSLDTNEV